ncbi:unnamed protein product [Effrenium voratum]|nr:unnamed protein product [Effrenium voratum]
MSTAEGSVGNVEPLSKFGIPGHYAMNIDLSCNSYITDKGVEAHLVSFLQRPACQRLKLYKNALGDPTLKALSSWVADGHAHELHLSDLSGKVTSDGVLHFLKEIHQKQKYPYGKGKCPLWLRLEHNGISDVDGLLEKAQSLGISVSLVDKHDLARVRPGKGGKDNVAINLVMFRQAGRGKGHVDKDAGRAYESPATTCEALLAHWLPTPLPYTGDGGQECQDTG